MKILFILELYKPHIWWVEILFDNVINWLIDKWHKVTVLTSRFDNKLKKYEKINDNLEIHRVWTNRYNFMRKCIKPWVKLAKKHDIIHTTTYNSAIPASIIGKISNKKVILTVHEIFWKLRYRFKWRKWFFFKTFESLIFKFNFEKFICVSNYTKNSLRVHFWLSDKKLITVYNGIDYDHRNKSNFTTKAITKIKKQYNLEDKYVWLYFGRSWISKWLKYYIQAIPEVIKKIPKFKAILIVWESKNNPAKREKELIKKLWIEKNIIWLPWVEYKKLGEYILASDCVIVPSLVEWFGFSAAETCALWQQLVVSNVASLTEVVSGKINFAEPSNSDDIAQKIIDFNNKKHTTISDKKFYWDDNIKKTLYIYKEILWK